MARFDNFIIEDTSKFYETFYLLCQHDASTIENILLRSWIKLRESLSHDDQMTLLHVINESFDTDYPNIYYVPTQIKAISDNWKNKINNAVPKAWLTLHESIDNNMMLTYGLIWAKLVSSEE
jgi:hypothetical protein